MSRRAGGEDQIIAANVKSLRAQRGMAQRELAERLGVSIQQVQKYEAGETRMAVSTLCRIAEVLKVAPVVLLPGGENGGALAAVDSIAPAPGDEDNRAIASNLRTKRLALGLSQQEVAEKAHLSVGQLQAYERGGATISASKLYRLAAALGVNPATLFPRRGAGADATPTSEEILELLNLFVSAGSHLRRRAVLEFARAQAPGAQCSAELSSETGKR